ncbi:MAG: YbhN family protein, partial [Anaerolineae bacterium]
LSLALLAFLLTRVDLQATLAAFREAEARYLLAALALYLVGVPLRAYRWHGLLSALHVVVPVRRLTSLYFVGTFFNNLLPTGVGGDVIRAYELSKDGAGPAVAASTVFADRATGLLVLLAMAMVSTLFGYRLVSPNLVLVIAGVALGSFAGVALLLWDDLWRQVGRRLPGLRQLLARKGITDFYRFLQIYRGRAIVNALLISLIFNVVLIAVNELIALSMGVRVSLWYFLLFIPLISFSLVLPVSVSGLGVRESAYVLLFSQAGVGAPLALAMSLAFYVLNVVTGLIGGVIYALQGLDRQSLPS